MAKRKMYKKKNRKSIVKIVKGVIAKQAELKFINTSQSVSVSSIGAMIDITPVAQGDTDFQRDGDSIYVTKCVYRIATLTLGDTINTLRILIFRWMLDDALVPPIPLNLLDAVGFNTAPVSGFVIDNQRQKKFQILSDKLFSIDSIGGTYRHPLPAVRWNKVEKTVNFNAASVSGTGKIYLLIISDSNLPVHPVINVNTQLFFRDM